MGKRMEIQEPRLQPHYLLSTERASSQSQPFTVVTLIHISSILDGSQDSELETGKKIRNPVELGDFQTSCHFTLRSCNAFIALWD